jgi:hypothetical protein
MTFQIKRLGELNDALTGLLSEQFKFNTFQIPVAVKKIGVFLKDVKPDCYIGIESQYVDKLYRDIYYHYYSSKLYPYRRDCIRLSFFSAKINAADFHSEKGKRKLQKNYLGFLVIRPTPRNVIGRNVLRPDIFQKAGQGLITTTSLSTAINGIKLSVEGFPHTSQDSEFMVCAETTIWSIMEYFGHRYPDYSPVLPKKIHNLLATISTQRQVPSPGLSGLEISYALKGFGFGVKQYSSNSHPNDLLKIIQIYVESGIPVITAIRNHAGTSHVNILIGRTPFDGRRLPTGEQLPGGGIVYDYYDSPFKYLLVDDNLRPYQIISLEDPACNHVLLNPIWKDCEIVAAIVPLHSKIYVEADRAREIAMQALRSLDSVKALPSLVLRVLLTSSRSFKEAVSLNPDLSDTLKKAIVDLNMPKFVWIAELGTQKSYEKGKATGMILLDATEPKKGDVLAYLIENTYFGPVNGGAPDLYNLSINPFTQFQNLKLF